MLKRLVAIGISRIGGPFKIKTVKDMTKTQEREGLERAMKDYKKPVRVVTKEDELMELAGGDWTDFTMRCGECGFIPGNNR